MNNSDPAHTIASLIENTETNDEFLKELIRGRYAGLKSFKDKSLIFGVARRWNSWYPSYFDVLGGCYVIIPGDLNFENKANQKDDRNGVIVIDPGFKFIEILRSKYQIEPQDVRTVIVTHFHPDHMAGLIEYATIMNTSKTPCRILLNETMYATFKSLQSGFISVSEFADRQVQEILRYVSRDGKFVRISIRAVEVHHDEIGNQHKSLGLVLETTLADSPDMSGGDAIKTRIGILGDTDGNEEYIPEYVKGFRNLDLLTIHLGTFSNRKHGRGGKHLYISGTELLLNAFEQDVKEEARSSGRTGLHKVVVLSEFGLELADEDSLYLKLYPYIRSHHWRLPIIYSSLYGRSRSSLPNDKVVGTASKYFARATLDLLLSLHPGNKDYKTVTQASFTKGQIEELILSLSIQFLIFDEPAMRKLIESTLEDLRQEIVKARTKSFLVGIDQKRLLTILNKKITDSKETLLEADKFYDQLVKEAGFGKSITSSPMLYEAVEHAIELMADELEDPLRLIYYSEKLDYITRYSKSRNVPTSNGEVQNVLNWSMGGSEEVGDISVLWVAGLIGQALLLQKIKEYTGAQHSPVSNNLIKVGNYFQSKAKDWANIIVGDIGCNFGINVIGSSGTRRAGISLQSSTGTWISPHDAESVYIDELDSIGYKEPG